MANTYKDSLFRSLFNDSAPALELYNSIKGTSYSLNDHQVQINTLKDTFFTLQKNDVSFLLDEKLIVICEHQSTINENMPLRFLPHITRLFDNCLKDKRQIYGRKRISLPAPEFLVLYNGEADYPDRELKLSDAFRIRQDKVRLELVIEVYNINAGRNTDKVKRSNVLNDYVVFVDVVRRFLREGQLAHPEMDNRTINERALGQAISWCLTRGILKDFLARLSPEEKLMLTQEWNMEDALAYRFQEGLEEGLEKGIEQGIEQGIEKGKANEREAILRMLEQVNSIDQLKQRLTMTLSTNTPAAKKN